MEQDDEKEVLEKWQLRELKHGRAKMMKCANCGKETYYGDMPQIALAISGHKPVCGYECNKALGQVK